MAGVIGGIKEILKVKIKVRHDAYSDQFSRVFMVKILMIGSLVVGLNWFNDKITCIVPDTVRLSAGFVADACWIQGFYIFEELTFQPDSLGYYGIPVNIDVDGKYSNGKLCSTSTNDGKVDPECKAMKKTFFLQYQYMPFFLAALAILYYTPYLVFRTVNSDMMSLKGNVKTNNADALMKNFFNYKVNSRTRMRIRVILNILIKILYILSNVLGFLFTDKVLHGNFRQFGLKWAEWVGLDNSIAYDYMGLRKTPKPGNALLPTFGLCEVQEGARDARHTIINSHKFICEYSQNILYHYVMIMLWYMFIVGIIVAILGFIIHIIDYMATLLCFMRHGGSAKKLYKLMTLREYEYLEFIRRKNLILYGEVLGSLKKERFENDQRANSYHPMKSTDSTVYG